MDGDASWQRPDWQVDAVHASPSPTQVAPFGRFEVRVRELGIGYIEEAFKTDFPASRKFVKMTSVGRADMREIYIHYRIFQLSLNLSLVHNVPVSSISPLEK